MVTATESGRDLILALEGVEPFTVRPLPGRVGEQITRTYLEAAVQAAPAQDMIDALIIAVDGAEWDDTAERWVPVPESDRTNYTRIQDELRQAEGESILMPALLWQTVLGFTGVEIYLKGGEGVAGGVKALEALTYRLGLSAPTTSSSSALDALTLVQGSIPSTSSPRGGVKPARRPQGRRRRLGKR